MREHKMLDEDIETEIEETSREIERLSRYLAELVIERRGDERERGIREGDLVRVIKKDEFYGRVGRVHSRRSKKGPVWYLDLEKTEMDKGRRIWKKEKFLVKEEE